MIALEKALALQQRITITSFEAFGITLKKTTALMGKWLLTNPAGWAVLAVGAIAGVVAITDALTESLEEAQEKAEASKQKFDELTSELESLNSELLTTQSRIRELEGKGLNLTLVEQDELVRLKEQNDQLEREIELKEYAAQMAGKQAAKDAENAITKESEDYTTFKTDTLKSGYTTYGHEDRIDAMQRQIDLAENYKNQQAQYERELKSIEDSYRDSAGNLDIEELEKNHDYISYKDSISELDKQITEAEEQIQSYYDALSSEDDALYDEYGNQIEGYEDLIGRLDAVYNSYLKYTQGGQTSVEKLSNYFSDSENSKTVSKLEKAYEQYTNGEISKQTLESMKEYATVMDNTGISAAGLTRHLKDLNDAKVIDFGQDATNDIGLSVTETVKQLNDQLKPAFDKLSSSYQAIFQDDGKTLEDNWIENVDIGMLDELRSSIQSLNDSEDFDINIDLSNFENMAKVLSDSTSTVDDIHNAFDSFATSIVDGMNPALSKMDEEAYKVAETLLTNAGVTNTEEVLLSRLGYTYDGLDAIQASYNAQLSNSEEITHKFNDTTDEEIIKAAELAIANDEACEALARLAFQKALYNESTLNTAQSVSQLLTLANAAGITGEALRRLGQVQATYNAIKMNTDAASTHMKADLLAQMENLKEQVKVDLANVEVKYDAPKSDKDKSSKGSDKAEKATENFFDWIERRVKKLQRLGEQWLHRAENALTSTFISHYYEKEAKNLEDQISTQAQAYVRYMQEANSVGLSEEYASKVRNGEIDLENITDEDLSKKIQKYQENFDKAIGSLDSFYEAVDKKFNIPLERATKIIERLNKDIELNDLDKSLAPGYKNGKLNYRKKNSLIEKGANIRKEQEQELKNALDDAKQNLIKETGDALALVSKLPDAVKAQALAAIAAGKEFDFSDYFEEGTSEALNGYEYNASIKAVADAEFDLNKKRKENTLALTADAAEAFDNIANSFEQKIYVKFTRWIDRIGSKIDLLESAGMVGDSSLYEKQRNKYKKESTTLENEYIALLAQLQNIPKGTDEYYAKLKEVDDKHKEIVDNQIKINELTNSITQLWLDRLDRIRGKMERFANEDNFLAGMLHGETSDSDIGGLTQKGFAQLVSATRNASIYQNNADSDNNELSILRFMRETGKLKYGNYQFNSIKDLDEAIENMTDNVIDDFQKMFDAQEQAINSMKEAYQAEYDFYNKMADNAKKALTEEKNLRDYQKTLTEKTNNINSLQQQLAAYAGDTSQEGMAARQRLNADLIKAQEDLEETEWDHALSVQQDMIDNLMEQYQEQLNELFKNTDELLRRAFGLTSGEAGYLQTIAEKIGYTPEQDFNKDANGLKDNVNQTNNEYDKETKQKLAEQNAKDAVLKTQAYEKARTKANNVSDDVATKFIKANARKASKAKNSYSKANQYIYELTNGKILSKDDLDTLSNKLSVKNDNKDRDKLNKKLRSLKLAGFSQGGLVGKINSQIRANKDDGIASVKVGEAILTPTQTKLFAQFVSELPAITNLPDIMKDFQNLGNNTNMQNNINYGGIVFNFELPNVTDARAFITAIQQSQDLQKAIQSVSIDKLNGGSRLGVNRIR